MDACQDAETHDGLQWRMALSEGSPHACPRPCLHEAGNSEFNTRDKFTGNLQHWVDSPLSVWQKQVC